MRFRSSLALGLTAAAAALAPAVAGVPAGAAEGGARDGGRVCAEVPAHGRWSAGSAGVVPCDAARGETVHRAGAPGHAVSRDAPRTTLTPRAADQPTCTSVDSAAFPLDTRIHRGPAAYEAGGDPQEWTLDLTNTTDGTCGNIHPILVLVDQERTLKPRQVRLEFDDGERERDVAVQKTARGENIGVFGGGFPGFTVGPGRTVTVKVRLAFADDTVTNHVVASAALVQRRNDDGDWVGESNGYPFDIVPEGTDLPSSSPSAGGLEELAETGPGTPLGTGIAVGAALLGAGALAVGALRLRAAGKR
ncbi:hypothetical protein [Streptomyces sp. KL118A]|uniref:hypothetical protein n=1 Tax=Streptomyces sp. KL118A TaxID=3045153 RepID=UPI00278C05CB|nr:hypothetical protein [Streptomyces sp. KL118A]